MKIICDMTDCIHCNKKDSTCTLDCITITTGYMNELPCCINHQQEGRPSLEDVIYNGANYWNSPYC